MVCLLVIVHPPPCRIDAQCARVAHVIECVDVGLAVHSRDAVHGAVGLNDADGRVGHDKHGHDAGDGGLGIGAALDLEPKV